MALSGRKTVGIRKVDVENDVKPTNGMLLKDAWGITSLPTFVVAYNDTVMYSHIGYSALSAAAVQRELEEKSNEWKKDGNGNCAEPALFAIIE